MACAHLLQVPEARNGLIDKAQRAIQVGYGLWPDLHQGLWPQQVCCRQAVQHLSRQTLRQRSADSEAVLCTAHNQSLCVSAGQLSHSL